MSINIFKKLLRIGQRKLDGSVPNDVEDHAIRNELYQINKYAYTYYSTNEEDDTMSVEFVCLAKNVSDVLKKCKQRGFWYVTKRFDNDSPVEVFVDKHNYANTKKVTQQVLNISKLHMKTAKNPDGWEIDRQDGSKYHLVRHVSIHLLDPLYVQNLLTEYETSKMVQDWWKEQIEEASDDLNEEEFMSLIPHLAIVTVEDPRVGQTTLYRDIFESLQEVKMTRNSSKESQTKSKKTRLKISRSKNNSRSHVK